jgi:hypothetical protein
MLGKAVAAISNAHVKRGKLESLAQDSHYYRRHNWKFDVA